MVDRLYLEPNEEATIDTQNNTVAIVFGRGTETVEIRDANGNTLATLRYDEIYTLPINTGTYKVINTGTVSAVLFVFRSFII